jgi:FkbM family methyltransferase
MKKVYVHWHPDLIEEYNINMRGLIHIGIHWGLEYDDYINYGIKDMIFFEPVKATYDKLLELLPKNERVKTYNLALGNMTGEVKMFIETANLGQSSSILEPGTHLDAYPQITFDTMETVKIDKLDNIEFDRSLYNVINVDVQGYELEVLKGAEDTLRYIDVIFSEINTGEVYKNCAKLNELDEYLVKYKRVYTKIYDGLFYGDAIYIKK